MVVPAPSVVVAVAVACIELGLESDGQHCDSRYQQAQHS